MSDPKVGTDFFGILKDKDPALAASFENIQKKGMEDWVNYFSPHLGSHTGLPHLRDVERIANRIIPDELKSSLSAGEIFLLLSAIFLHDIGKTISTNKRPLAKCNHPKTCKNPDKHGRPSCYKLRKSHFVLGEEFIKANGILLGLPDEKIAQYCGLIVFCHGLRKPPTDDQPVFKLQIKPEIKPVKKPEIEPETGSEIEPVTKPVIACTGMWPKRGDYRTTSLALYGVIRIPLLASILRIADETDDSWTRASRGYWLNHQKSKKSKLGKAFRRCIEDIEFCSDGQCLVMHIPDMDDIEKSVKLKEKYVKSINKVSCDIRDVIKEWGPELKKIGVQFNEVYLEYKNHLYSKLELSSDPLSSPLMSVVEGEKNKKSVKEMIDAMIDLSLGSYGYFQFTWKTLEAQVGHPLSGVDQWLAKRIADASNNHIVINEQNQIWIELEREKVDEIKKLIYV